ncbi:ABC transporter substrate-binding protein [bacterium]|nr:ABC transporter substrate-binding protein [bacterium]
MLKRIKTSLVLMIVSVLVFGLVAIASAKDNIINLYMYQIRHWDPHVCTSDGARLLSNIYETLLIYDNGKLIPVLATSWESSPDGKVWTFKLREGVKFHNGEKFNATAVKYSLERVKRMNEGPAWMFEPINKIEIVDEYTVKMICENPTAVDLIMSSYYGAYMLPPKLTEEKGTKWFQEGNGVGTGPYQLVAYETGVQVVMKKFDDYWGGWKPNQFDLAIFKVVNEPSTGIQLLKRGELDTLEKVPVDLVPGLLADPKIRVDYSDSVVNEWYDLHTRKAPTDDINVRKAIIHAVNTEELVTTLLGKSGSVAKGPLPPSIPGYSPNLKGYEYNPEKAMEYLKKSKYADQWAKGEMKVSISSWSSITDSYFVYMQAALKKVGIEAKIDKTPWPAAWDKMINIKECPQITIQAWWADYATPSGWFVKAWFDIDPIEGNWAYYQNPEFEKTVKKAMLLEATDKKQSNALYEKAQQMLMDDAALLPLADKRNTVFMNKRIKGFRHLPIYNGAYWIYKLHL